MKRLILIGAMSAVASCDDAEPALPPTPPPPPAPTTLILECDVKLTALEGNEITQRRTYKIDLAAKTIRFWQDHTGVWVDGGSESQLTFETPTELTFEGSHKIGTLDSFVRTSFDRAIGAVEGTVRLRGATFDRTSRFAGPCKAVDAPGQNNAF